MWKRALETFKKWTRYLTSAFLLAGSLYCIWGWITISDLKSECQRKGLDSAQVLSALQYLPAAKITQLSTNGPTSTLELLPGPAVPPGFRRYSPGFHHTSAENESSSTGTKEVMDIFMVSPLNPFLFFADNALNVIFCFALGYAISSVFVLLKYLKRGDVSERYALLRPIAGGAVSACIFVMVLSGGNLIWQQVSGVNGLSVGVIAAIGSVYCERFERILTKSLQKTEQPKQSSASQSHQPGGQADSTVSHQNA